MITPKSAVCCLFVLLGVSIESASATSSPPFDPSAFCQPGAQNVTIGDYDPGVERPCEGHTCEGNDRSQPWIPHAKTTLIEWDCTSLGQWERAGERTIHTCQTCTRETNSCYTRDSSGSEVIAHVTPPARCPDGGMETQ